MCQHGERRVARLEKDGKTITVLADHYDGKRFNSPNDVVVKSNGDIYFTDPPYGLMRKDHKEGEEEFPGRELDFCGIYRISKDGKLTLLNKDVTKPNGIAFSPDEKTLYISSSDPEKAVWMAFDVKDDGTLGKGRVFYDATEGAKKKLKGLPDGMKVDKDGNLFATGPGGLFVLTPEAKLLGVLATGVATANCNWGDDGSVLYVCADKNLCRIKTQTKGNGSAEVTDHERHVKTRTETTTRRRANVNGRLPLCVSSCYCVSFVLYFFGYGGSGGTSFSCVFSSSWMIEIALSSCSSSPAHSFAGSLSTTTSGSTPWPSMIHFLPSTS